MKRRVRRRVGTGSAGRKSSQEGSGAHLDCRGSAAEWLFGDLSYQYKGAGDIGQTATLRKDDLGGQGTDAVTLFKPEPRRSIQ